MIPVETFARDLWEAIRDDLREGLGAAVSEQEFDARFPSWEALSVPERAERVVMARDDVLKILDRAGYQVRKKKEGGS